VESEQEKTQSFQETLVVAETIRDLRVLFPLTPALSLGEGEIGSAGAAE
jgi:hypothetical protein